MDLFYYKKNNQNRDGLKNKTIMIVSTIMPLIISFDTKPSLLKLTSEEEINLRDIKINFDYREIIIDLNNTDSEIYSLLEEKNELTSLGGKLKENKESIDKNLKLSFENNEEVHVSDKYYQEMKNSHNEIYKNKVNIEDVTKKIKIIRHEKEILINTINNVKLKRKKELLKLKKKVRNRYINSLKMPITLSSKGSISCVSRNMDKCILDNKKNITNTILSNNNYNTNINNKKFIVNNATMNYSGFLSYNVSINFLESYNKDTNLILNKLFETMDFKLILRSNFPDVKYIIDDVDVGSGSVISTTISAGKHKITATHKSLKEVANVHISKDSDFTFSFQKSTKNKSDESKLEIKTKDNIEEELFSLFKNPILKVAYSEGGDLFVIPTFPTLDKDDLTKHTVNNGKEIFGKLNYKQAYNICKKITGKSRILNNEEYKLLFNIDKFNTHFNSKLSFWTDRNSLIHSYENVKPYSNLIGNVVCYIPS